MNALSLTLSYLDWFDTPAVKSGLRLGDAPLRRAEHEAHVAQCKAAGYGLFTLHDAEGQLLNYYFRITRHPVHGVGDMDVAADTRDPARDERLHAAGRALLDHAFGTMKLRKVNLRIDRRNVAARYHADRAGFVLEGCLFEEGSIYHGRMDDVLVYGLLAEAHAKRSAVSNTAGDHA